MKFDTIAVHGGHQPDKDTHSRAVPIYQTTSYVFDDSKHAADLFGLNQAGNIYTRIGNPTTAVLEERIAMLDNGVGALATASGHSAIMLACLNILNSGDELVASSALYGGTYSLFANTFKKLGITAHFVSSNNPEDFEKAITDKTKLIFAETIGNPALNVLDFEKIAEVAHKHNIPFVLDNTVATPYMFKPFEHGVDIAVYSATKFLGGHGTSMAGLIVDSGKFDWSNSGKFDDFSEPDPSYHGLKYSETFGSSAFIIKARIQMLRDMGPAISPFNSFLILQGLETLHLRMQRHCENAQKVADFLSKHPCVSWVNYPGLKENESNETAQKYFKNGFGALIGFGIKGGQEAGIKFIDNVKLLSHLANIGDAKTLVIHPASTTHSQLSEADRLKAGVKDDFVRLSIGIEDVDDIIKDIEQALLISQQ